MEEVFDFLPREAPNSDVVTKCSGHLSSLQQALSSYAEDVQKRASPQEGASSEGAVQQEELAQAQGQQEGFRKDQL